MTLGTIAIFTSCSIPTNRPPIDWYKADHNTKSIIGPKAKKSIFSKHQIILSSEEDFSNYACLHKEDFKGLIKYLIELERSFDYVND